MQILNFPLANFIICKAQPDKRAICNHGYCSKSNTRAALLSYTDRFFLAEKYSGSMAGSKQETCGSTKNTPQQPNDHSNGR